MHATTWRFVGLVSLLSLSMGSATASAQQTPPTASPATVQPPAAAPPVVSPPPPEKAFGSENVVSDREKPAVAAKSIERQKEILKRMLALLEEARNAKDVVKLNCVNEKLTQVKGLVRISEQSEIAMQEAIAQKDSEVANHEFTKISLAGQRSEQLRADTESCVGELAIYSGDTVVTVEGDKGGADPTVLPGPELIAVRPPPASPYQ